LLEFNSTYTDAIIMCLNKHRKANVPVKKQCLNPIGWIGWLGFNGILSTQVAAISCLRKFKVC